ncbi:flagellar protein FlgN [Peribacillus cavernae]|uniref:Flagellar protein FlgN n=1 Tax=Peribacillus cavernae TaxID=1674310 RepID=A0A3S0VNB1_9BACI|nr:flagellar protein FlgN [Peribacillus cavernae]MDQ0218421.1 flagellar biosynthesis/type III secretory pathway chaperone [Peribacillus cavernae]RUQ31423.1 flagellar protein FlgN [Peribacillus cavernae]
MPAEQIRISLEKLLTLHKSLNGLANRKTEIVKQGDTEALNQLLMDEQAHIKAIETTEKERQKAVTAFLLNKGQQADPSSITRVIELSSPTDAEALNRLKDELIEEAGKLKEQNLLNQQLVYQSLQFVNITLDMLRPQNQPFNYEKPARQKQQGSNSMFDSRA